MPVQTRQAIESHTICDNSDHNRYYSDNNSQIYKLRGRTPVPQSEYPHPFTRRSKRPYPIRNMPSPDIISALARLSAAFKSQQLEVPVAIVLKDADEAMRLMWYLRDATFDVRRYVEEDKAMSSMKVMGIEIRWPRHDASIAVVS